jgi:hypothetical protein
MPGAGGFSQAVRFSAVGTVASRNSFLKITDRSKASPFFELLLGHAGARLATTGKTKGCRNAF